MIDTYAEQIKHILFLLFLALLFWLPIPMGSKLPWAISVMEIWIYLLATSAAMLAALKPDMLPLAFTASRAALLLFLAAVLWIGIQCIPLPAAWVAGLSAQTVQLQQQAGVVNSFYPLSLDANTSFLLFQQALAMFLLFCLTLVLIDSQTRLRQTAYVLLISGLIQALTGAFAVFTMQESMALNEYTYSIMDMMVVYTDRVKGTFTNPDHLAGYLEMTLAIGIGLMLSMLNSLSLTGWRQRLRHYTQTALGPKARIRIMLIILCITLVMTHSRMGNSAFFFSLLLSGTTFLLLTRHAPKPVTIFLTSMIILDILIIGSWFGFNKVASRIEQTTMATESRDEFVRDSFPMLHDFSVTGIGAGNYFSTFPAYKQADLHHYINHAPDYMEFAIELGLIGIIPILLLILLSYATLIRNLRLRRAGLLVGMSFASLMGISSILIHSAVDFNLHIPSNAALFTVLLAFPFLCRHIRTH
ncbi:MAG: hypothetical protein CO188_07850 [Zetaproteobacteria bacterium CG_4_9_14_3_um_filter_54_145]|nr:MAG: hypothetical protein COZ50_05075 [Zetaproteobacteria bacterium CG_4_10_14_3_um_filter_54_28]PJA28986.1 MAG: hypothetical protein CO188_07850 [Zetaproteobacteria bacterium CG_4_9_14_3_um_filter_54_145]